MAAGHREVRLMAARRVVLAAAVAAIALAFGGSPAHAQGPVDAQDAELSSSASCAQGDIEITYTGSGVERQITSFTAANGADLHTFDVKSYAPAHNGLEYVLSQTATPPAPGTVVAVHVIIGTSPAKPATSGEFFVVYRCDAMPNSEGGNNVVLDVCVGPYGTCPSTAAQWADRPPVASATPLFTG